MRQRKRDLIDERKEQLNGVLDSYDSHSRELWYLESNLPLLDWDPAKVKNDMSDRLIKVSLNDSESGRAWREARGEGRRIAGNKESEREAARGEGLGTYAIDDLIPFLSLY